MYTISNGKFKFEGKCKWNSLRVVGSIFKKSCVYNAMFGFHGNGQYCVISELCFKGTILQRNYKKLTMEFYKGVIAK